MPISRCLAILMLILFLASTSVIFAVKRSDSGDYAWVDTNNNLHHYYAHAWASADVGDQGYYSIFAEVGANRGRSSGPYQGPLSRSVFASETRVIGQPAPNIFHSHFIN